MSQLPVVIRRDIRDQFESDKSPLQEALKLVRQTIGYTVVVDPDWKIVWSDCEKHFDDKSTFVPYVISQITTLCDVLQTKLEDEEPDWTETFLERIEQAGALKVIVQLHDNQRVHLSLSNHSTFILSLSSKPSTSGSPAQDLLHDLDNLFSKSSQPLSSGERQDDTSSMITSAASDFDDFEPVFTPTSSVFGLPSRPAAQHPSTTPQTFPSLASLARPDILLSKIAIHIIHLRIERIRQPDRSQPDRITLQATHEPSLKLLHEYFLKYNRSDPQTREKIPLLRHTLGQSCLGPGMAHDTLIIEPFSQMSARSGAVMNVALYQAFIESVLGYEVVHRGQSGAEVAWEYRRTTPFA